MPEEKNEKSLQITERFFRTFNLSKIRFLHCFLPIERFNEIDTNLIFHRIWHDFPQTETVVPRVNSQINEIESLKYTSETELVQNSWQIHEPAHNEFIEAGKIDLVLVPLLCFDLQGFRVGYGKGYYDKFLSKCRKDCLKIGLSFFPPIAEIKDAQEYDVKLDFCITPQKVYQSERKNKTEKL